MRFRSPRHSPQIDEQAAARALYGPAMRLAGVRRELLGSPVSPLALNRTGALDSQSGAPVLEQLSSKHGDFIG